MSTDRMAELELELSIAKLEIGNLKTENKAVKKTVNRQSLELSKRTVKEAKKDAQTLRQVEKLDGDIEKLVRRSQCLNDLNNELLMRCRQHDKDMAELILKLEQRDKMIEMMNKAIKNDQRALEIRNMEVELLELQNQKLKDQIKGYEAIFGAGVFVAISK
ncbi:unknown protein [Seminavis robusta]|uniref:Uncharacterized protein n=1 Tax=Seminavis robusta TaxID=568900 RepID=A0A9N8DJ47_9STRA|nr:unknown protein [Seminavis robusta]|eukprot:Sro149_g068590.1 n/a (161) ;mRNA; f:75087-75569